MAKSRVKKRPDGRYMMQIYLGMVDGKRKYKSVYGTTPKEVETKAEEVRVMMGKGLDVAAMRDTFSRWAERWLKLKKSTVSPAHYVTCAQKIETINQWLGSLSITEIRPADVQGMILDLSAKNPYTGKPTAKRTLVEYRSVVHQVCQMAIDNRLMDYNPASAVKIATEAPRERRRALTTEEQGWILNTPHRAQRAAMLMMLAGLRRGEVIPLTWADVDLDASMIRVNKSVAKVGTKFEVKSGAKTAAGERVVQIPKILVQFLQQQPREGLLVCPDTKGQMMTETSWRRMWESYQKELNARYGHDGASKFTPGGLPEVIPNITPHMLRHTFCSLKLTPEEKQIKEAVMDTLKARIAYANDGMLATYKSSDQSFRTMMQHKVRIEGNQVTQNGEPLFAIHRRFSSRKTQGCYRELLPKLEYIRQEKAQDTRREKPSIRDQLKAAARSKPEQSTPAKSKKHEMGLE